jgi:hypothetical protein
MFANDRWVGEVYGLKTKIMERPKIGHCQRIDLAPSVLLVNAARLHEVIEWSVWAEQELSKLHQPTVSESVCSTCRFNKSNTYHDKMWCRDCRQGNHFEQTVH